MNLRKLSKVCDAATPGPWDYVSTGPVQKSDGSITLEDLRRLNIVAGFNGAVVTARVPKDVNVYAPTTHNAAFVATFNPSMVAKLLAIASASDAVRRHANDDDLDSASRFDRAMYRLDKALDALREDST
jgi:hypothetical protein